MKAKFLAVMAVIILMMNMENVTIAGGKPSIYGRVMVAVGSVGRIPLGGVTVKLVSMDKSIASPKTSYADSRGNFAFYGVAKGKYELQVLAGAGTMRQNQPSPTIIERRKVNFLGGGLKLPDIVITKKGF